MPSLIYNSGLQALLYGTANLPTRQVRAMLTTAAYAENKDTHRFRADVTNEVATGAGYTAGGVSVTVGSVRDDVNDLISLTFGEAIWTAPPAATLTARKLVFYVSAGSASADLLLALLDFVTDRSATNQQLRVAPSTIRLNNSGV